MAKNHSFEGLQIERLSYGGYRGTLEALRDAGLVNPEEFDSMDDKMQRNWNKPGLPIGVCEERGARLFPDFSSGLFVLWVPSVASRPTKRATDELITERSSGEWGTIIVAVGTRDELIASGLAGVYMFEGIGKRGRDGSDEHGDKFMLRKRARGEVKLTRVLRNEPRKQRGRPKLEPLDVMSRVLEIRNSGLGGA